MNEFPSPMTTEVDTVSQFHQDIHYITEKYKDHILPGISIIMNIDAMIALAAWNHDNMELQKECIDRIIRIGIVSSTECTGFFKNVEQ
jgi:hypothetical protein